MKYLIVEIQVFSNGNMAQITTTHPNRANAEQKYHEALMYAATSDVAVHSAVMLDETGRRIKGETYYHGEEPADAE